MEEQLTYLKFNRKKIKINYNNILWNYRNSLKDDLLSKKLNQTILKMRERILIKK